MKVIYRLSPGPQFEYVEVHSEEPNEIEPKEIARYYEEYSSAFRPKPINSLNDKEYDTFIQNMLEGGSNHVEDIERMSPEQQKYMQIVKRALNRIEYKINKN